MLSIFRKNFSIVASLIQGKAELLLYYEWMKIWIAWNKMIINCGKIVLKKTSYRIPTRYWTCFNAQMRQLILDLIGSISQTFSPKSNDSLRKCDVLWGRSKLASRTPYAKMREPGKWGCDWVKSGLKISSCFSETKLLVEEWKSAGMCQYNIGRSVWNSLWQYWGGHKAPKGSLGSFIGLREKCEWGWEEKDILSGPKMVGIQDYMGTNWWENKQTGNISPFK